jgi:hypothetical protein
MIHEVLGVARGSAVLRLGETKAFGRLGAACFRYAYLRVARVTVAAFLQTLHKPLHLQRERVVAGLEDAP